MRDEYPLGALTSGAGASKNTSGCRLDEIVQPHRRERVAGIVEPVGDGSDADHILHLWQQPLHLVAESVVSTCFGDHPDYRHVLRQGGAQLRFRGFDTASIFMEAKPRDMNVVLGFALLGALLYQLRQLAERLVEVGHLQAARVPDRERNTFLRDTACRLRDRLSLTRRCQPAVEEAVNERALADTGAAGDEHVDVSKVASCFVDRFVHSRCQVQTLIHRSPLPVSSRSSTVPRFHLDWRHVCDSLGHGVCIPGNNASERGGREGLRTQPLAPE